MDTLCIAMEYLEHGDLHDYMRQSAAFSEKEGGEIAFQVLEGLNFMHENKFAHRDLKPANILLKSKLPDVWVKIADFGISKRVEEELGTATAPIGTTGFIAPELHGLVARANDFAPDMWSLGEISFQMLSHEPTFGGILELMRYVKGENVFPSSRLYGVGVGESTLDFIRSIMKPDPQQRLNAKTALAHPCMKTFAPESLTPSLSFEAENTPPVVNEMIEEFGRWTLTSTSRTEASGLEEESERPVNLKQEVPEDSQLRSTSSAVAESAQGDRESHKVTSAEKAQLRAEAKAMPDAEAEQEDQAKKAPREEEDRNLKARRERGRAIQEWERKRDEEDIDRAINEWECKRKEGQKERKDAVKKWERKRDEEVGRDRVKTVPDIRQYRGRKEKDARASLIKILGAQVEQRGD